MTKNIAMVATLALALVFAASCGKDDDKVDYTADADCTAIVSADNTYTNGIKTILDASCASAGCHDALAATEGVDMSDYAKVKVAFQSKDALCTIHHGAGCTAMPDGAPQLSSTIINKIDCWAKNGYAE